VTILDSGEKAGASRFFHFRRFLLLRTRVYIDGYNLYYGCLKGTSYKWLDLVKLFKEKILPSITAQVDGANLKLDLENLTIKYFTAEILEKLAKDPDSRTSQKSYLGALAKNSQNSLEIIKGNYSLIEAHAKQIDLQNSAKWPRDCQTVSIWKVEEKKSDVSLALHAFKDAILGEIEHAVIVTNDTDIQPALAMINALTSVKIGLVVPTRHYQRIPNQELNDQALWVRSHITEAELASCELPRVIPARRPYSKPISWYPCPHLIQKALDISKAHGMKTSDIYKWLQQPNAHWENALPLDLLSNEDDGQKVLDFMTGWQNPYN
jgi:6-hydroxy-3-succinoylpyridine 3-monooxygenase